jgi:lysozyme
MSYTLSSYGVTFITTEESFAAKSYDKDLDWTIGYGHTGGVTEGETIDKDHAIVLFKEDVIAVTNALWRVCPGVLSQCQVDALTSLLFNCGTGLLHPDRSLGMALAGNDKSKVADAILLYDSAVINGVRGPFLATRRKAEYDMFNGAEEVSTPSGLFKTSA